MQSTEEKTTDAADASLSNFSAESPCVQICTVEGDICIGCGRTLDEIGRWGSMSDDERRAANARIERDFW